MVVVMVVVGDGDGGVEVASCDVEDSVASESAAVLEDSAEGVVASDCC